MMPRLHRAFFLGTFLALATLAQTSGAQNSADGTVTGTGAVEIKRQPDVLRMEVTVSAEAMDAKEAVAKLKALQTAAKAKLTTLGASDGSIDPGAIRVQMANDRQQQMQRMVRMRMSAGKKPTTAPASEPVAVEATLRAEWPLQKAAPDEVLIAALQLQQKIKSAGLMAPRKAAATPEEQEEQEEAAASSEEGAPGTPTFLYVCKVSAEDRAKATSEAFAKAKAEAAQLALAAGATLGGIRQLSTQAAPDMDESMQYNNSYRRYMYAMMQQNGRSGADAGEAIGGQPGEVSLHVTVTAAFSIGAAPTSGRLP